MSLDTWVSIGSLVVVALGLFAALSAQNTRLRKDLSGLRGELKGDISELRGELRGDISELRGELKGDISELRGELRGDISESRGELRGDIRRLDDRVAGLDDRVYALAVGLRPSLQHDEPVDHGGTAG